MNAYIVNDTEFYAANNADEAEKLHRDLTQDEEIEVTEADLSAPWRIDGETTPRSTVGQALKSAEEPGWMGSTEI